MIARGMVERPYAYEFTLTGISPEIVAIFNPPLSLRSNSLDSWLGFGGFHTTQSDCNLNYVDVECTLSEGNFVANNSPPRIVGRKTEDEKPYHTLASTGKMPWIFHRITTNQISELKIKILPTKRLSKKAAASPPTTIDGKEIKIYFCFKNQGRQTESMEHTFKEPRNREINRILEHPFAQNFLEKQAKTAKRKQNKATMTEPQTDLHPITETPKTSKRERKGNSTYDTLADIIRSSKEKTWKPNQRKKLIVRKFSDS